MHTKGKNTIWEEICEIDMMFRGQVMNQIGHLLYKAKLFHIIGRIRYAFQTEAITESDVRQIGYIAMQSHRESYLDILAAKGFVTEQKCIFLVGFSEDIGPIECSTQVEHTHVVLGDDGL